jgi:hypothetical protein
VPSSAGIVVRACVQLLEAKEVLSKQGHGVFVSLSAQFVEIYDEKVSEYECACDFILCIVILFLIFLVFYVSCACLVYSRSKCGRTALTPL